MADLYPKLAKIFLSLQDAEGTTQPGNPPNEAQQNDTDFLLKRLPPRAGNGKESHSAFCLQTYTQIDVALHNEFCGSGW